MAHPPIIQQITFLDTTDLVTTERFYEDVLGLTLALDQGTCRIYQTGADAFLGFCQRKELPDEKPGVILTLVTPEVDAWYEYLQARGVSFEKEPVTNPDYQIYHCMFRDPNGYLVEIQHFLDPRWK